MTAGSVEGLLAGIAALADPAVAAMLALGTLVGLAFGLVPGLGSVACIAMLTPLTYGMAPMPAVALMAGVMATTSTSGAVTSIVLNAPGTSTNAATVIDGHPLARRGRAGYAIGAAALASGAGGLFGLALLFLAIPAMRDLALAFGPPEIFLLGLIGLAAIAASERAGPAATLASAAFGLMLGLVGYDGISGEVRFAQGSLFLWDGLALPAVIVGLFAGSEMIRLCVEGRAVRDTRTPTPRRAGQVRAGVRAALARWRLLLQSAGVGAAIGVIPAVGGTVASFVAYAAGKAVDRRPASFGRGAVAGVIAPEAANNAKDGGALVPTLAFGIPGSAEMSMFFGVMMLHGIEPGPGILTDHAGVVWMLLAGMAVAGVAASAVVLACAGRLARVAEVDGPRLAPLVLAACFLGAFAIRSEPGDMTVLAVFALVGLLFLSAGLPRAPFAIGFVLGPVLEVALFQSLLIGEGSASVFVRSTASHGLIAAAMLMVGALAAITRRQRSGRGRAPWSDRGPVWAVAGLIGGTAVLILAEAASLPRPVGLFPALASALAIAACLALLLRTGLPPRLRLPSARTWQVCGLMAVYPAVTALVGFVPAVLAVTFAAFASVGGMRTAEAAAIAALAGGGIWLVFGEILGLRLTPI